MKATKLIDLLDSLTMREMRLMIASGPAPDTIEELKGRIDDAKRQAAKERENGPTDPASDRPTKAFGDMLRDMLNDAVDQATKPDADEPKKRRAFSNTDDPDMEMTAERIVDTCHKQLEKLKPDEKLLHFVITATYGVPDDQGGLSEVTNAVLVGQIKD